MREGERQVSHADPRVPSDRSRDSAQLSLRRHVRWSGKRSGNEHFCLSERPSHFSKSALRADIVIHCLREPRGQDAKRIVIIWRWQDGRSFEQLAGCRASQNHRSNAACTWAAAVKAAAPVGGSRRGRQNVPKQPVASGCRQVKGLQEKFSKTYTLCYFCIEKERKVNFSFCV